MTTYAFDDFHHYIQIDAPGVPPTFMTYALRDALIEFCQRSEAWVYTPSAITLIKNIPEYTIDIPANTAVHTILQVSREGKKLEPSSLTLINQMGKAVTTENGTPKYFVKGAGDLLRLYPTPAETDPISLQLTVSLQPLLSATEIEGYVADNFYRIIIEGALSILMQQVGRPWYNPRRAADASARFFDGIHRAKSYSQQDHTPKKRTTGYGGIP